MGYFESRVPIDINNFENTVKKIRFLEKLNYKNLILEPKNIEKISNDLKIKVREITNINIYYRINLKPKNLSELKRKISNFNKFPDIVSVESSNNEVLLFSARDTRVDVLSFSDVKIAKALTPGVISLSKQYNSFIEFSFNPIFLENKFIQSKNIHLLISSLSRAIAKNTNYILSGNFSHITDYRSPKVLTSICQTFFNMTLYKAKQALIENPQQLIKKISMRNDPDVIEDGVRIISNRKESE